MLLPLTRLITRPAFGNTPNERRGQCDIATFHHMDYDIFTRLLSQSEKNLKYNVYKLYSKYLCKCNYKRNFIRSIKSTKFIGILPMFLNVKMYRHLMKVETANFSMSHE